MGSANHPKAQTIFAQGDFLISGESMEFVKRPVFNDGNDVYRLTPSEIQAKIAEKDADVVYAFQVRNPLHNGHVLLLKDTREQLIAQGYRNPILLLHPLGGWCKDDDVPLTDRMAQHAALLSGNTLFITGRDPAGVKPPETGSDLYDVWHGQKLLVHCKQMLNGVDVLPFKVAAYNTVN